MQLSAVRELKEELRSEQVRELPRAHVSAFAEAGAPESLRRQLGAQHVGYTPPAHRVSLGVAKGPRRRDYRLAVRVYGKSASARRLAKRYAERASGEADVRLVPKVTPGGPAPAAQTIARIPGTPGPSRLQRRTRPLYPGLSCGHYAITAGTLGAIVTDGEALYILSNNHVLADVNNADLGDPILQPGPMDAQKPLSWRDVAALLSEFVPISKVRSNLVDCAIAEILDDSLLDGYYTWNDAVGGELKGHYTYIDADFLGEPVAKIGRTTGATSGIITQVELDGLSVSMGGSVGVARFSEQFEVIGDNDRTFSLGGDSGSLIVTHDRWAVGLLFAGGPDQDGVDLTFANAIGTVMERLDVDFA